MADSLKINRLDNYPVGDTLKIGQSDMQKIASELLKMEGTKYGSLAEVIFSVGNADGSMYNISGSEMGLSASNTLTGVTKTEIVNKNITLQNKDAASINNIRSFAGKLGAAALARTGVSFALSNYGNWTQDPLAQMDINNLKAAAQPVANIAMATAAGGLVGFIAGVISEGVSYGIDFANTQVELHRNSMQSAINRKRVGINVTNSGGR